MSAVRETREEWEARRAVREAALAKLRADVKASPWTYGEIADRCGNTSGWVGVVLRGGYPHYGACYVPTNIVRALERCNIAVPEEVRIW